MPSNNDEQLKILDENDKYKFIGTYENSKKLDNIVCEEVSEEFLDRVKSQFRIQN